MTYINKTIDSANKLAQFELKSAVSSLGLKFNDSFETGSDLGRVKCKVELVSKDQANVVVVDSTLGVVSSIFSNPSNSYRSLLPVSLNKTFQVGVNDSLLITLDFSSCEDQPTSFAYVLNTNLLQTSSPMVVKHVSVVDTVDLDTRNFDNLVIGRGIESLETTQNIKNSFGGFSISKVSYGAEILATMKNSSGFIIIPTSLNQVITMTGSFDAYLIKY